jgi:hypothetical protein
MEREHLLTHDVLLTARFDGPFGNRDAVMASINQRTLEELKSVRRSETTGGDRTMLRR